MIICHLKIILFSDGNILKPAGLCNWVHYEFQCTNNTFIIPIENPKKIVILGPRLEFEIYPIVKSRFVFGF